MDMHVSGRFSRLSIAGSTAKQCKFVNVDMSERRRPQLLKAVSVAQRAVAVSMMLKDVAYDLP